MLFEVFRGIHFYFLIKYVGAIIGDWQLVKPDWSDQ